MNLRLILLLCVFTTSVSAQERPADPFVDAQSCVAAEHGAREWALDLVVEVGQTGESAPLTGKLILVLAARPSAFGARVVLTHTLTGPATIPPSVELPPGGAPLWLGAQFVPDPGIRDATPLNNTDWVECTLEPLENGA